MMMSAARDFLRPDISTAVDQQLHRLRSIKPDIMRGMDAQNVPRTFRVNELTSERLKESVEDLSDVDEESISQCLGVLFMASRSHTDHQTSRDQGRKYLKLRIRRVEDQFKLWPCHSSFFVKDQ